MDIQAATVEQGAGQVGEGTPVTLLVGQVVDQTVVAVQATSVVPVNPCQTRRGGLATMGAAQPVSPAHPTQLLPELGLGHAVVPTPTLRQLDQRELPRKIA